MFLKRGVFIATILIIGSLSGIASVPHNKLIIVNQSITIAFFLIAMLVGVAQLITSYNYQRSNIKKKVLFGCFAVEVIHYIVAAMLLLMKDTVVGVRIFGLLVAICMITMAFSAMLYLIKIADRQSTFAPEHPGGRNAES